MVSENMHEATIGSEQKRMAEEALARASDAVRRLDAELYEVFHILFTMREHRAAVSIMEITDSAYEKLNAARAHIRVTGTGEEKDR